MASGTGDARPDRVYGVLVQDGRVLVTRYPRGEGLPGGIFRPMADDRKVELRAHLFDQLGIVARAIWAQGAFRYQHPLEEREWFSGFYSVWDWEGQVPEAAGRWLDAEGVESTMLGASLRILLLSLISTLALRTT